MCVCFASNHGGSVGGEQRPPAFLTHQSVQGPLSTMIAQDQRGPRTRTPPPITHHQPLHANVPARRSRHSALPGQAPWIRPQSTQLLTPQQASRVIGTQPFNPVFYTPQPGHRVISSQPIGLYTPQQSHRIIATSAVQGELI